MDSEPDVCNPDLPVIIMQEKNTLTRGDASAGLDQSSVTDGVQKTALEEANVLDPASAACWGYLALANLRLYDLGDDARVDRAAACVDPLRLYCTPLSWGISCKR